jgi:hypothetical protein
MGFLKGFQIRAVINKKIHEPKRPKLSNNVQQKAKKLTGDLDHPHCTLGPQSW